MDNMVIEDDVQVVDGDNVEAPAGSSDEIVMQAEDAGQAKPDSAEETGDNEATDEADDIESNEEAESTGLE
jgi:hypothetical protein